MQIQNIGDLVASRTINLINHHESTVTIKIGKPQRFPDGEEDYYCPFQITGLQDEIISYAGGIDTVQALLLAMERIGVILQESDENKMGQLVWVGGDNLGFPCLDSSGMLVDINKGLKT